MFYDSNIRNLANKIEKIQIDQSEIMIGLKEVEFQLQESLEERSKSTGHVKVSASNTDGIYKNLESAGKIIISPEGDGPPVIDSELIRTATETYNQTPKRPHDKKLVNLYKPSLIQVVNEVSPDLRLVNSEVYAWFRCASGHSKSDLKPDLFSTCHPLVEFRSAYANAPTCAEKRLFGKFTRWESRSSLHCIWDGKWVIDWDAFGEKCKYLQIAGEDCNGYLLRLKGVLFDVNQFWMITSHGNAISEVVICKWSQSGSKQLLVDFLSNLDPWQKAATAFCVALGVTIRDFFFSADDEGEETAFLGSGANGRVFRLSCGAAIKIVLGKKSKEVEKRYKLMLMCQKQDKIQTFVFPVQEGSYRSGSVDSVVDYAGYILTRIGHKISSPPLSNEVKLKLMEALYLLHSNNVIHGDSRTDNALILDDGTSSAASLRWIDFRDAEWVTTKISIRRDVEILFKSIDGAYVEDFTDRIRDYMNDPTLDKLRTVFSC